MFDKGMMINDDNRMMLLTLTVQLIMCWSCSRSMVLDVSPVPALLEQIVMFSFDECPRL